MKVLKLGLQLLADKLTAVTICASILLVCFLVAGEYVFFFEEEIHNGIYLEDERTLRQKGNKFDRAYLQPSVMIELEGGHRVFAIYDLKLGPKLQNTVRVKELRGGITGRSKYYVLPSNSNAKYPKAE